MAGSILLCLCPDCKLMHMQNAKKPQNELQGQCEPKHGTQKQESGSYKSNFSVSLSHTCVSLEA